MMADALSSHTEHRRKRVRKGTKSCWECKRRKIRCDYLDSEPFCAGCLERGTKCVSQEFVDDQAPPSGIQLGQRIGRVEWLLEQLMQKVDSTGNSTETDHNLAAEAREPLGIDVLTPSSSTSNQYENVPILSLFDNAVFGRSTGDATNVPGNGSLYASPPTCKSQATSPINHTKSKLEKLRRPLLAILPSQHDVDKLLNDSDGWWLLGRHILPNSNVVPNHDFSKPISVQNLSQSHPIIISRLLLVISLSIQQLPYNYDTSQLRFVDPLKERMEKFVNIVANIISDDELIGSLEGIECLILQGVYYINAGSLRRSWLCFRRAINIAQLMGLHLPLSKDVNPANFEAQRRHYLWFQLVKGDRFLSLILGLPSAGSSSQPFPFDDGVDWLTTEEKYNKKLSMIAGLLVDRNQAEPSHAFSTTQNIDEKLENLAKQMPISWWEVPEKFAFGRNQATIELFDRLLVQVYHYELESLIHLPYMLRAADDRRYEYSRLSCLSASRNLIQRWLYIRNVCRAPFVCRIIEFQAFKAAITLLLGILQPTQIVKDSTQLRQEEDDMKVIDDVRNVFKDLETLEGNIALAQSAEVLKTLQSINLNEDGPGSNIRLSIPHFGTISLGKSQRPATAAGLNATPNTHGDANGSIGFQVDPAPKIWQEKVPAQGAAYPTPSLPVFTFMSAQFPPLTADMGEWPFNEDDTLLFDSLMNTDLEGNWNF